MMSFRNLVRSTPRNLSRLSTHCARSSFSTIRQSPFLKQSVKLALQPKQAAFSTTRRAWASEGQVDPELSAKFQSELEMEKEMRDSDELPPNVQEFLDNGPFKLHDTPGQEEVTLTRQFGDEHIRLTFTIADLNNLDEDPDSFSEDKALYDEEDDNALSAQSGGANTKGSFPQGRTKGGNVSMSRPNSNAPADRPELNDEEPQEGEEGEQEPSFPARVNVTITKPGSKGAMQIETTAQDGTFAIDNVYYYPKKELAEPKTTELDWERRELYTGPPFGNLDEDLQELLERFLDERGINTALALWIPEFIDHKEQREYLSWLSNVKAFVDA